MHTPHYHLTRIQELPALFATHSITAIARGLVGIFIPIYLYTIGFSLAEILLFFGGFYFADVPYRYFSPRVLGRLGANKCMILGHLGTFVFFAILPFLNLHHWLLWLLIPLGGISTFYWLGFHATFSKSLAHRRVGKTVSMMNLIILIATSITPVIGGALATIFGPESLYVTGAILFLLGALVLLMPEDIVTTGSYDIRNISWREHKSDIFANAADGIIYNAVEVVAWPLFVFLLIPSFVGVGALSTAMVLTSAAITIYVGRKEESKGERRYLKQGIVLHMVASISRALSASPAGVLGANLLGGVSKSYMQVAYNSRYYENAQRHRTVEYIALMELTLSAANGFFCLVLAGLALVLSAKAVLVLALLAAVPLSLAINRIR